LDDDDDNDDDNDDGNDYNYDNDIAARVATHRTESMQKHEQLTV